MKNESYSTGMQTLLTAFLLAFRHVALYKPNLVLTSFQSDEERGIRKNRPVRRTLYDLDLPTGLHSCGRLDRNSEGLLLLTDDGQFTQSVHNTTRKTYWVLVRGVPNDTAMETMRAGGLSIRGVISRPPVSVQQLGNHSLLAQVSLLPNDVSSKKGLCPTCWLEVVLTEGRNRQVRRITKAVGHPTIRLVRVSIGNFSIFDNSDLLQAGAWKFIEPVEVLTKTGQVLSGPQVIKPQPI